MRSKRCIAVCLSIIGMAMVARIASAATPQAPAYQLPSTQQVIAFVLQSLDWYRHTYAEREIASTPADVLFVEDTQPIEKQIVRLSFEFAKADAAVVSGPGSPHNETASADAEDGSADLARFMQLQSESQDAIEKATQQVEELKKKAESARIKDRSRLEATLHEAQSRLELLETESQTIHQLIEFVHASTGDTHNDFASMIGDLAQTVPEVNSPGTAMGKSTVQRASARGTPHDSSILDLASDVSALKAKLRMIDENTQLTDALASSSQNLHAPIVVFIRAGATEAIKGVDAGAPAVLQQQKTQFDTLTAELKSLSPTVVALDKQRMLLTVYRSHLTNWRGTVAGQYRKAWKKLIIRVVIVGLIIAMLIAVSIILRNLAQRHVHDDNRRRLLGTAQRLFIVIAILIVLAFAFASDLTSFATYFGLLTAGIAVALQNVIVAGLGYLVLAGSRGIRTGDRVQISGVTGDVMNVGLLQFQLREFDVQKQRYTGHTATFSNSLVFVSPATGLLNFNVDHERVLGHESKSAASDSSQSVVASHPSGFSL